MTLDRAILATLAYSNHFSFPLTLEEIHPRLIGQRTSLSQLKLALTHLVKSKKISTQSTYYFLPGRASLIQKRESRAISSSILFHRATSLSRLLSRLPGILAIYLTGSLAVMNANHDADIDLMIITQNGQLWTTRLILTLYTSILGLRRFRNSSSYSGKLCLNLYLTPTAYRLPKSKRSLYTAYELIQSTPLHDPFDTRTHLLSTNAWIKNYLPNFKIPTHHAQSPQINTLPFFSSLLEDLSYNLQYHYMKNRITREYITKHSAFFHPDDPSKKLLRRINPEL